MKFETLVTHRKYVTQTPHKPQIITYSLKMNNSTNQTQVKYLYLLLEHFQTYRITGSSPYTEPPRLKLDKV